MLPLRPENIRVQRVRLFPVAGFVFEEGWQSFEAEASVLCQFQVAELFRQYLERDTISQWDLGQHCESQDQAQLL
jgi:hypothetical protein